MAGDKIGCSYRFPFLAFFDSQTMKIHALIDPLVYQSLPVHLWLWKWFPVERLLGGHAKPFPLFRNPEGRKVLVFRMAHARHSS